MKCLDCGGYRRNPEEGSSILWAGPGMGDYYHLWWNKAFLQLFDRGFKLRHLRSIDLKGAPKRFFNPQFDGLTPDFVEENIRANFFHQKPGWDIIIIDFIEAWLRGNDYWPTLAETPYRAILHLWREKILELRPKQVWVVHDNDPHSTIIPDLSPEYELVDIGLKPFFPGKGLKDISIWQRISV